MPELPEVETVARELADSLSGQYLRRFQVRDKERISLRGNDFYCRRIKSVYRSGKQVILGLANNSLQEQFLVVHLRMTGRLIYSTDSIDNSHPHLRVKCVLDKGSLLFVDPRKFGTMELCDKESAFKPIGIDPMSSEFSVAILAEMLAWSQQNIKLFLLRQDKIVGLGNIYASEILFKAGIHPLRAACSLKLLEIRKLHSAIKKILAAAIDNCGTTFSDFQRTSGRVGGYQKYLRVYKREGLPCVRCRQAIKRLVQGQRSTFLCSGCQK